MKRSIRPPRVGDPERGVARIDQRPDPVHDELQDRLEVEDLRDRAGRGVERFDRLDRERARGVAGHG